MGLSGLLPILKLGRKAPPPAVGAVSFPRGDVRRETAPPFGSDAWLDQIRREREERIFGDDYLDFPPMPRAFSAEGVLASWNGGRR